jgi:spermidine/putrescine transport system permease protein
MKKKKTPLYLLSPLLLYFALFFFVPMVVLFVYSFWTKTTTDLVPTFTLSNYAKIFSKALYPRIIWNSLRIGLVTAGICVLASYPVAYALTFKYKRLQDFALYLILISLFSSYLVRVYAWKTILGTNGLINQILITLGLIEEPVTFLLYSPTSVIITLVFILIPFTVLPIFSSLQNINLDLLEAARDLGANSAQTFFRVILPLSMPGIVSGFTFSFILAAGDYVTPQMVGGTSGLMIGRIVADQFGMIYDWPFGSALSYSTILLLILVVAFVNWALRATKLRRDL